MRKLTLRLVTAIITFGVGVVVATLWPVQYHPPGQTPALTDAPSIVQPAPAPVPASSIKQGEAAVTEGRGLPATSIAEEWRALATTTFCLTGSQYHVAGREPDPSKPTGGEELLRFSPYGWLPSVKRDEGAAIEFLINQIPDKRKTRAHVCPLANATRGELAVYCLQHILRRNWPELSGDYGKLFERKAEDVTSQDLLRGAIRSKAGARKMMALWRDYHKHGKRA